MKLRNAVAATLGALALTLSMSGSALAAQGDFHYTYTHADAAGAEEQRLESALHDPANDTCINLAWLSASKTDRRPSARRTPPTPG